MPRCVLLHGVPAHRTAAALRHDEHRGARTARLQDDRVLREEHRLQPRHHLRQEVPHSSHQRVFAVGRIFRAVIDSSTGAWSGTEVDVGAGADARPPLKVFQQI